MRLLMVTQRIDLDDSILGFAHIWASKLAERIEKLYILALWLGRHSLPSNVEVYSVGKERGIGKIRRFINFNKAVAEIILSKKVNGVFIHQCPIYAILCSPYTKLVGIPMVSFYGHKSVNPTLRIAHILLDKVVTSSEEGFRINSKKKTVISQGIDTDLFKPLNIQSINGNNKRKILSVGRISPIKNYETLIEAANILINEKKRSDIEFEVIGDVGTKAQETYFESLKGLVQKYNLQNYFYFRGAVPNREVAGYYQRCDIHVNLCPTGGMDKAVLEAMACGKVVLVSNETFRGILGSYSGMMVFEESKAEELSQKIEEILHLDDKIISNIGQDLRQIVVTNHSVEGFMDRLVGVFNRLISV